MSKLHEILAVEGDLEGQWKRILSEAESIFRKGDHFNGQIKVLHMFDDSRRHEEAAQSESKELTTTVRDKLNYMQSIVVKYLDVIAQKEATNQEARADIEIDGTPLIKDLPATLLLGLETKLKLFRIVAEAIPTLTPGKKWIKDEVLHKHAWVTAEPERAIKTQKIIKPFVLYEATKEHPAQVRELADNENVGEYITTLISGCMSPAEKSDFLGRIDTLLRAVKTARMRANTQEVKKLEIGRKLWKFMVGNFDN